MINIGNVIGLATGAVNTIASLTGFSVGGTFGVNPRLFSDSSFTALCTIEEDHTDNLTITSHPVEFGANISDHAYMEAKLVNIKIGYSEAQGTDSLVEMYNKFLMLQSEKTPFSIITGKRAYLDMLIESIRESTDGQTENSLILNISCREVIIVNSKTTEATPANQADAANTASPTNNGNQSLKQ